MKLTIESTDTTTTLDGTPARVWKGTTESGIPCAVFVTLIAVERSEDTAAFAAELANRAEPTEMAMREILTPAGIRYTPPPTEITVEEIRTAVSIQRLMETDEAPTLRSPRLGLQGSSG